MKYRGIDAVCTGGGGPLMNCTISNCWLHGVVDGIYLFATTNVTITHCQIYDIWAITATNGNLCQQHDNMCVAYASTNITFCYNQIWNWASEGIGLFGEDYTWYIYGNVFHDCSVSPGGGITGRIL